MRTSLIAFGAAGALAALLAACGGGGSGTAPVVQASPAAVASINPNQTVNNFTGPTSKMTVTINVPPRVQAPLALRQKVAKLYGTKNADANVRSMANVSPSAVIRAAGQQQNRYAAQVQQRTGRDPTFISGSTEFVEFVLSDSSNNPLVDSINSCTTGSCTNNYTVPVGTGFTVSLFLYDDCNFLIGAGALTNQTVNAGVNNPVTVTINGVVRYFNVTSTVTNLLGTPAGAQSVPLTITPFDEDNDVITTPGVLLDSTFRQITSVSLSVDAADTTPTGTTSILIPANLTATPTYAYAGTGGETSVNWTSTVTPGSPIVPNLFNSNFGTPALTESPATLSIPVTPIQLSWTNPTGYPVAQGDPQLIPDPLNPSGPGYTDWILEFPNPVNPNPAIPSPPPITVGVSENLPGFAGNITLSDNGNCVGVVTNGYVPAFPGTYPYSQLSAPPYVQISMNSSTASSVCMVTAVDDAAPFRTSNLFIYTDQTNIVIQDKARKH